jgi:archaeal preflagellin peptidase FlaK
LQSLQSLLDLARTALALVFLFYASWSDNKTREVSNTVWMVLAPLAFALTFAEVYVYQFAQLPLYGICFGFTALFAIAIFYAGGFGGADAKALMCLALVLPFFPIGLLTPLYGVSPIQQTLFPLSIFSNSVLLAALMTLVMLGYNVVWRIRTGRKLFEGQYENGSIGRKILVLITGYKAPVQKLKDKWHVYPLEDANEDSENSLKRKLVALPKDEGRDAVVERLDKAVKEGKIHDGIWATPGLPFLIFITAGLVLALFVGDIVWICIARLLALI